MRPLDFAKLRSQIGRDYELGGRKCRFAVVVVLRWRNALCCSSMEELVELFFDGGTSDGRSRSEGALSFAVLNATALPFEELID